MKTNKTPIQVWRMRMKRFYPLKWKLLRMLDEQGWDLAQSKAFLEEPRECLKGRSLKDLYKPSSMPQMVRAVRKLLALDKKI